MFLIAPEKHQYLNVSLVVSNGFVFAPGCTDDIFSSDHSPVFATFEVGVTSQLSSKTGAVMVAQNNRWVVLDPAVLTEQCCRTFCAVAQIQQWALRKPGLSWKESRPFWRRRARPSSSSSSTPLAWKVWGRSLFQTAALVGAVSNRPSTLLFPRAGTRRSSVNDSQSSNVTGFLRLGWSFKQLPKVTSSVLFGNMKKTLNAKLHPLSLYFTASSNCVRLGEPSRSTPAPLCQVVWWVWVIWLVQIKIPN